MNDQIRKIYRTLHFYVIKLPFIYITVPIGFLFEYLVTFPYIIMVSIDTHRQNRRKTPDRIRTRNT